MIPYCWVEDGSGEELLHTLRAHPAIASVAVVDEIDNQYLIRISWEPDARGFIEIITQSDVVILSAVGTAAEWTFEIRTDDHTMLAAFHQECEAHDVSITITSVHHTLHCEPPHRQLTDAQSEALLTAYNAGYFDNPREATLEEIGEQLGISRQAVADRLKRGYHALIESFARANTPT